MRVYRSVCTYIWNDDKFPYASDDCQLVWFHLFTNPCSSPLGVFRASLSGLAEDKNRNGAWPIERYTKAFQEALRYGFVKVDRKALLVSFPKYFSAANVCNHPQSPNVVTSWGERFADLPNSPLKLECYHSLKALLEGKGEAFLKAFLKAFGDVYPHPSLNTDPDSLLLIPDSLSLIPEQNKKKMKSCKQASPVAVSKSSAVWESYRMAYREKYHVEPVRNQQVNALMCRLVDKLGMEEAPAVAAYYLSHGNPFYVSKRHPMNLLVQDAEGLRTQWATGNRATSSEARHVEFKDNLLGKIERVQKILNERGTA